MTALILRVGLTGNIAAGKSTVAGWMAELDCRVIDLDRIAHDCLVAGQPTHDRVVAAFGSDVFAADGGIDRRELGAVIFADPEARKQLEDILHPAIREREEEEVEAWAATVASGIAVSEAALLYETGGAARYDRMVVVAATEETRLQRLLARGTSAEDARLRMAAQMNQQEKIERADYVIDNDGSLDAARMATEAVVAKFFNDLESAHPGRSS